MHSRSLNAGEKPESNIMFSSDLYDNPITMNGKNAQETSYPAPLERAPGPVAAKFLALLPELHRRMKHLRANV